MEKIKCVHIVDSKPCKGTLAHLYVGNVFTCRSSEIDEHEEFIEDCKIIMEKKCTSCKKKVFIMYK